VLLLTRSLCTVLGFHEYFHCVRRDLVVVKMHPWHEKDGGQATARIVCVITMAKITNIMEVTQPAVIKTRRCESAGEIRESVRIGQELALSSATNATTTTPYFASILDAKHDV
jgi:hypothetical protein